MRTASRSDGVNNVGDTDCRAPYKHPWADRSYDEWKVETELEALDAKHVAIPRRDVPVRDDRRSNKHGAFARRVKWRTGSEGRIAHLKLSCGWEPTVLDGMEGARSQRRPGGPKPPDNLPTIHDHGSPVARDLVPAPSCRVIRSGTVGK
jgi:IS5 family transposase